MIGRPNLLDAAFSGAHGLIRKSLQPQDPCKEDTRRYPRIKLKENGVRPMVGNDLLSEHALDMVPSAGLVAQIMLRGADQPISRSFEFAARLQNLCASVRANWCRPPTV